MDESAQWKYKDINISSSTNNSSPTCISHWNNLKSLQNLTGVIHITINQSKTMVNYVIASIHPQPHFPSVSQGTIPLLLIWPQGFSMYLCTITKWNMLVSSSYPSVIISSLQLLKTLEISTTELTNTPTIFIFSEFIYASPTWFSSLPSKEKFLQNLLQKKACKIILGPSYTTRDSIHWSSQCSPVIIWPLSDRWEISFLNTVSPSLLRSLLPGLQFRETTTLSPTTRKVTFCWKHHRQSADYTFASRLDSMQWMFKNHPPALLFMLHIFSNINYVFGYSEKNIYNSFFISYLISFSQWFRINYYAWQFPHKGIKSYALSDTLYFTFTLILHKIDCKEPMKLNNSHTEFWL